MSSNPIFRLAQICTSFPVTEEQEAVLADACKRVLIETAGDAPVDDELFNVQVNRVDLHVVVGVLHRVD